MSALTENITSQTEDFLQAIYRLQERNGAARTGELVKTLKVVPGTITNTVERLEKRGLVTHKPYRGVKLTEKGRRIALRLLRRHRLSERLLTEILDVRWDRSHRVACQLEHGVSDDVASRIEKILGHPGTCPHGNPIPTKCGGIIEESSLPLAELNPQDKGIVFKIIDERSDILEYLGRIGIEPQALLEVVRKAPPEGHVTVRVNGKDHVFGPKIASIIRVQKVES